METVELHLQYNPQQSDGNKPPDSAKVIDRLIIAHDENIFKMLHCNEFISLHHGDCLQLSNTMITVSIIDSTSSIKNTSALTHENTITPDYIAYNEPDFPIAHLNSENSRFELDTLLSSNTNNDPLTFLFQKGNQSTAEETEHNQPRATYRQPLPLLKQHFQAPTAMKLSEKTHPHSTLLNVPGFKIQSTQGNILQELGLAATEHDWSEYHANYLSHLPQHALKTFGYQNGAKQQSNSAKQISALPAPIKDLSKKHSRLSVKTWWKKLAT